MPILPGLFLHFAFQKHYINPNTFMTAGMKAPESHLLPRLLNVKLQDLPPGSSPPLACSLSLPAFHLPLQGAHLHGVTVPKHSRLCYFTSSSNWKHTRTGNQIPACNINRQWMPSLLHCKWLTTSNFSAPRVSWGRQQVLCISIAARYYELVHWQSKQCPFFLRWAISRSLPKHPCIALATIKQAGLQVEKQTYTP